MKSVRDVVSREIIDDLWGAGYTILPRRRHPDPFFVPPEMVPATRSYQWWHLVHDKIHYERPPGQVSGWSPVPASRHDGYFMPAGFVGDIEVSGLGLFEKSKAEVDQEHAANAAAAHKQVDDWKEKWGGDGITGHVRVGHQNEAGYQEQTTQIGETRADPFTMTIETTVRIPRDMQPYAGPIFDERDRLYSDLVDRWNAGHALTEWQVSIQKAYEAALEQDTSILKGPTLNALILPTAIENIRKQLKEAPDAT